LIGFELNASINEAVKHSKGGFLHKKQA